MEHIVTKKVSPIPRGYRTATTCMTVFDVDSAVAFYKAAFAAELLTRQRGADEAVALDRGDHQRGRGEDVGTCSLC